MSDDERDRAFEAFVAGRSPALLRTAYLVTGEESAAARLLTDALAETYLAWNRVDDREGVEEYVRRVMLTAHASSGSSPATGPAAAAPPDLDGRIWAGLRELTPRERAVLVLASRDQLDDDEIARVLSASRRAVQTDGTHAAMVVRQAVARPPSQDPPTPAETEEPHQEPPAEPPQTLAGLDAAIRTTLSRRADDVRAAVSLVDDARDRAERLRRERRSRRFTVGAVAAGLVVILAVVFGVVESRSSETAALPTSSPAHSEPSISSPAATSSGGSQPSASVVALPDSVLRLAHDNNALIAFGSAIVDSGSGPTIVSIDTDPTTGASRGGAIVALARAAGGYVVVTRDQNVSGPRPLTLSYVRTDGTRVELGHLDIPTSGFAVAPDGLSVVHVIKGPVGGENAVADGHSELVVQDLAGDVENRVTVAGDVLPISLTGQTVVFRRTDVLVNYSHAWDRRTGAITRFDVPTDQVPVELHDTRALLRTNAGAGCVVVSQALTPATVDTVWTRCGVFGTARFDPTGAEVAVVRSPEAKARLEILVAKDGRRDYSSPLDPGFPFQLEWTGGGQRVLLACIDKGGQVSYTAVAKSGGGDGVVTTATYEVPDGPVVLGRELPLPAAG